MSVGSTKGSATACAGAVLIVEDDDEMRSLLVSLVQALGFKNVTPLGRLEPALRQLEYQVFSMAIVDLNLGDQDGVSLIAAIRKNPRPETCGIPVLVASTASTGSRIRDSIQAGADAFLSKPFSIANLKRQIDFACTKAATRPANSTSRTSQPRSHNSTQDVFELD